jgi:DNA polymerase-3 subunit epsilon
MRVRQIVLDTETTGLEPSEGHRIIEIGCVELNKRRLTHRHFHQYLQPDRSIDQGAIDVHGITNEFLADKPRFADVAADFIEFVRGAELIIHNAPFDVGFINHELAMLGPEWGKIQDHCTVLDTLVMAREMYPGQRNSLDALCKRLDVENGHRTLHGALLDSEILADVYLMMTGGQSDLGFDAGDEQNPDEGGATLDLGPASLQGAGIVIRADTGEQAAHEAWLARLEKGGNCRWGQQ